MNISIQNVEMTYSNGKQALQGISATLQSPSLIGLVGPNGAGKSTLMKLLVAGLLPTKGEILLGDSPLISKEKELKENLGYLPQSFGLYDELTVYQFLDYMAALKGIPQSRAAIEKAMAETNLSEYKRTRIRTLSGGQRQRVGIAQAILGNPKLLILDEPTVGLDPEERINFRNLFSKAAQDKIVLLSTHIIEDVQSICNRIIILHCGIILFDGSPQELILAAQGHVGMIDQMPAEKEEGYHITARLNTLKGVCCRIVAEELPPIAQAVDPTLEDAYMYLIAKEEKK